MKNSAKVKVKPKKTAKKTNKKDKKTRPTYELALPSGQTAKIYISHGPQEITLRSTGETVEVRGTKIMIQIGNKKINARSCCKPPDNFNRHNGIKLALSRLLKDAEFDREDRQYLWQQICPWFTHQ